MASQILHYVGSGTNEGRGCTFFYQLPPLKEIPDFGRIVISKGADSTSPYQVCITARSDRKALDEKISFLFETTLQVTVSLQYQSNESSALNYKKVTLGQEIVVGKGEIGKILEVAPISSPLSVRFRGFEL